MFEFENIKFTFYRINILILVNGNSIFFLTYTRLNPLQTKTFCGVYFGCFYFNQFRERISVMLLLYLRNISQAFDFRTAWVKWSLSDRTLDFFDFFIWRDCIYNQVLAWSSNFFIRRFRNFILIIGWVQNFLWSKLTRRGRIALFMLWQP